MTITQCSKYDKKTLETNFAKEVTIKIFFLHKNECNKASQFADLLWKNKKKQVQERSWTCLKCGKNIYSTLY